MMDAYPGYSRRPYRGRRDRGGESEKRYNYYGRRGYRGRGYRRRSGQRPAPPPPRTSNRGLLLVCGIVFAVVIAVVAVIVVAVLVSIEDDQTTTTMRPTTTSTVTMTIPVYDIGGVPITISTRLGQVRGIDTNTGRAFRSIEYASASRFSVPVSLKDYTHAGILDVTTRPPGCPQSTRDPGHIIKPQRVSEDCLFLSLYTPRDVTSTSGLPVVMYLHGGDFNVNYGGGPIYDGRNFASTNQVIFIPINYRLGLLGFPYLGGGSTNLGLRDMIKALEWIQANIADYGGDPTKVTLMGQSAGGQATLLLITNPQAAAMFRATVVQSPSVGVALLSPSQAAQITLAMATAAGCPTADVACLRQVPVSTLLDAQNNCQACTAFGSITQQTLLNSPVLDNDVVTSSVQDYFTNNPITKPILWGLNKDEGLLYTFGVVPELPTPADYAGLLTTYKSCCVTQLIDAYPAQLAGTDQRNSALFLVGDLVFRCLARNLGTIASTQQPVWIYSFGIPIPGEVAPGGSLCDGKTCHGSDVVFAVGNVDLFQSEVVITAAMKQAETFMVRSLGNFVKNLDPGTVSPHLTPWQSFTQSNQNVMFIEETISQNTFPNTARCNLWDTIGYDLDQ